MNRPVWLNCLYITLVLICSLPIPLKADTFTHRKTGEKLHGYISYKKIGRNSIEFVQTKEHGPKRLNLDDYDIKYNNIGRRKHVAVLPIRKGIKLNCVTNAFKMAIAKAANGGPLFILIDIDTPGGRSDLMMRICNAITQTRTCPTVAFISDGDFGGALSAGAYIALSCNRIYMAEKTVIGAATAVVGGVGIKEVYGETAGEKHMSADRAIIAAIAEQNNRPGLIAKAMVDKEIEVLEVAQNGKRLFISRENLKSKQDVVHVWSKKGSLLTLNAHEAVRCGIADKIVVSHKDILKDYQATGANIVVYEDMANARRNYELDKRNLDSIYSENDFLIKKFKANIEEVHIVNIKLIHERTNYDLLLIRKDFLKRNTRSATQRNKLRSAIKQQEMLIDNIINKREFLLYDLLDLLDKLISNSETAISIGEIYPELGVNVNSLKAIINSSSVEYQRIKNID